MVMTDPIADMLTRIRNANNVKHETVVIPASNEKKAIANILLDEGFIKNVEFIATSKGVVTDKVARTQGIGGEVLGYIW